MLLDGGCVGGRLGGPSSSAPDRPVKVNGQDIQNQNLISYLPGQDFKVESNIILPLKKTYFAYILRQHCIYLPQRMQSQNSI